MCPALHPHQHPQREREHRGGDEGQADAAQQQGQPPLCRTRLEHLAQVLLRTSPRRFERLARLLIEILSQDGEHEAAADVGHQPLEPADMSRNDAHHVAELEPGDLLDTPRRGSGAFGR